MGTCFSLVFMFLMLNICFFSVILFCSCYQVCHPWSWTALCLFLYIPSGVTEVASFFRDMCFSLGFMFLVLSICFCLCFFFFLPILSPLVLNCTVVAFSLIIANKIRYVKTIYWEFFLFNSLIFSVDWYKKMQYIIKICNTHLHSRVQICTDA